MKRKVLISFFVIFLISMLTSCGPHFTDGMPIEDYAEDFVYNYWIAMINRQYDLARWYCIPNGIWYNKTNEWEEYINTNSEGEAITLVYFDYFYRPAEVVGEDIFVYPEISVHKIAFPDCVETNVDNFEFEIELIKIPSLGNWKFK